MKVLFVENRYKTLQWAKVASELEAAGHSIYWIVQNHQFIPTLGKVYTIPYYRSRQKGNKLSGEVPAKIIQSDRAVRYFGQSDTNYFGYYRAQIDAILAEVNPEVVFGESTLFHELLTIDCCKARSILYLHPITCRYPIGRFSFFKYDTLEPFGDSGEEWEEQELSACMDEIVNRTVRPDYMQKPYQPSLGAKMADKLRLSYGYFKGERFNTPHPLTKLNVEKVRTRNIAQWEQRASDISIFAELEGRYKILYPIQMQPEANIDVWGLPFNNQAEVVRQIAERLESDEVLVLKPNPKSKYEIDEALLGILAAYPSKIICLKHTVEMAPVIRQTDFVVTVTGTISIEAFLADKPFVVLGDSMLRYCFPQMVNCISSFEQLRGLLHQAKTTGIKHSSNSKLDFLRYSVRYSFDGINGDGWYGKLYLEDRVNQEKILKAFFGVITQLTDGY